MAAIICRPQCINGVQYTHATINASLLVRDSYYIQNFAEYRDTWGAEASHTL